VRNADQLLVLQDGRIVESGTHDQLLLRRGVYQQLFEMQTENKHRRVRRQDSAPLYRG